MPRPTPPGGPRKGVQVRLLASEVFVLQRIALAEGFDTIADALRHLLNKADSRFQAPEREDTK